MARTSFTQAAMAAVVLAASASSAFAPAGAAPTAGSMTGLNPGDVLVYDLNIDSRFRVVSTAGASQSLSMESKASGTETITGLRTDADGTIHGRLDLSMHGSTSGSAQNLRRTIFFKIAPDGAGRLESGSDDPALQYMSYIMNASQGIAGSKLHVGQVFHRTVQGPSSFPVTIQATGKVVGEQTYHGYPSFAIQTTGSGSFNSALAATPAKGTLDVAGTTYYDQDDRLLVGEAMRSSVNGTLGGDQPARFTASADVQIVMASLRHGALQHMQAGSGGTPLPAQPPPTAAPTATPEPSPSPTATSGYYTPTPPAPTPSPIVVPYPPSTQAPRE